MGGFMLHYSLNRGRGWPLAGGLPADAGQPGSTVQLPSSSLETAVNVWWKAQSTSVKCGGILDFKVDGGVMSYDWEVPFGTPPGSSPLPSFNPDEVVSLNAGGAPTTFVYHTGPGMAASDAPGDDPVPIVITYSITVNWNLQFLPYRYQKASETGTKLYSFIILNITMGGGMTGTGPDGWEIIPDEEVEIMSPLSGATTGTTDFAADFRDDPSAWFINMEVYGPPPVGQAVEQTTDSLGLVKMLTGVGPNQPALRYAAVAIQTSYGPPPLNN